MEARSSTLGVPLPLGRLLLLLLLCGDCLHRLVVGVVGWQLLLCCCCCWQSAYKGVQVRDSLLRAEGLRTVAEGEAADATTLCFTIRPCIVISRVGLRLVNNTLSVRTQGRLAQLSRLLIDLPFQYTSNS